MSDFPEDALRMSGTLRGVVLLALDLLTDRDYSVICDAYHLSDFGLRSESVEVPKLSQEYRERALLRARRRFMGNVEELLVLLQKENPEQAIEVDEALKNLKQQFESQTQFGAEPSVESTRITVEQYYSSKISIPTDRRVVDFFASHPEALRLVDPRKFEEIVAELLYGFEYSIEIGPRGRDGGVDVYATKYTTLGQELVLVQCKRFNQQHRVSEPIVKQLFAEVVHREMLREGL